MRIPALGLLFVFTAMLPGQNSTRKVRTPPGALAARVGSALDWQPTVAAALAKAKAGGKRVFWYVPTLAGSPMDRTPELDRYQRGGPYSWPTTIAMLQEHCIVTDEVPKGELQARYGLRRGQFLEPGWLLLDGDGAVLAQLDQVTSYHPEWFEAPLRRAFGLPAEGFPGAPALREAWDAYRAGDRPGAVAAADAVLAREVPPAIAAEARWLAGAALCRSGQRAAAVARWQDLASALPDQPLAWKAALEVEGHGPFGRGFEDYLPLPAAVLRAPPVAGSRAGGGVYSEAELWQRSVNFLLAMDDGDGVVRDSIYDFGGTDSLPNVHAAVTCLVGEALLAAERRLLAGALQLPAGAAERLTARLAAIGAAASGETWLAGSDRDEILWARAYALRFLLAWRANRPAAAAEVQPGIERAVGALFALQPETGAWFHEYGNPFAIATALLALHDAGAAGQSLDPARIDKGVAALLQNRTEQGAFTYAHTSRGKPRATLEAAAGRMPLCELALLRHGRSDQARLLAALEAAFAHHDLLATVRKYDDHADRHGYGGFFFWFDMLARTEAIGAVADPERRLAFAARQRALLLDLPEFDGVFIDSHELGRAYGTAMALLCFAALDAAVASAPAGR